MSDEVVLFADDFSELPVKVIAGNYSPAGEYHVVPELADSGRWREVVLHLLGPNFRPVQVTEDLASFWRTTYPQVRKDLRARYPKHAWPEDPFTAKPQAKGGRRAQG